MSTILAVYNRKGKPVEAGSLEAMLRAVPIHAVHGQDLWQSGAVGLGHQHFWVTPEEEGERQPLVDEALGLIVTADARLDNRAELMRDLAPNADGQSAPSDARLILLAYACWGEACAERLLGDFAFAVWDQARRQLFLARDAMGNRSLVYWMQGETFCAGTEISQILAHPAVTARINEQKIAEFLNFSFADQTSTFYQDIQYCPPAHCLLVTTSNVRLWRYWDFDATQQIRYRSDQEYAEHFRQVLTEAVRCRLRATGPAAISLSGGLDSSSLAALLAQQSRHAAVKSFSYVFDQYPSCDEREYIQQTVAQLGLEATYLPCDGEWTLRDIDSWPVSRDFVMFDSYARLPRAIARAAGQAGCRLLFAGYFGDSLFTGARFWLLEMLRGGQLWQATQTLVAEGHAVRWHRLVIDDGLRRIVPPALRQTYRSIARREHDVRPFLTPQLAERFNELRTVQALPTELDGADAVYAARRRSLQLSLFSQGPAIVRRMYVENHLELMLPYWDRRVAQIIMALPAEQLGTPERDRRVLRNAMADLLPADVLQRKARTIFLPLMQHGLQKQERHTVEALFENPRVVEFGFVREAWLRDAVAQLPAWGEAIEALWCCISLELWLRKYW